MTHLRAIHQMLVNAGPGNSISQGARLLRDALQKWGYRSRLYAETVAPAQHWREVQHFRRYRPAAGELLIVHYTQASPLIDYVAGLETPILLVYHNITPPHFFVGVNPRLVQATQDGLTQLPALRQRTILALADSAFNEHDLRAAGYQRTAIVPVLIPETLQQQTPSPQVLAQLQSSVNLLSVGRIAPNKRFEDVIKVFFYYRQLEPRARLFLVGSGANTRPYLAWLREFAAWLGLGDSVTFTGHVSDAELAAYYRRADAFIYMSEHEGFGIPPVESMRFGVPVLAYAAAAIPETMGEAGVLVSEKDYPVLAEVLHLLHTDPELRGRVVARQYERVSDFSPQIVLTRWRKLLEQVLAELA